MENLDTDCCSQSKWPPPEVRREAWSRALWSLHSVNILIFTLASGTESQEFSVTLSHPAVALCFGRTITLSPQQTNAAFSVGVVTQGSEGLTFALVLSFMTPKFLVTFEQGAHVLILHRAH